LTGVDESAVTAQGIDLIVADAHDKLAEILAVASKMGVSVGGVDVDTANLEAVFLHLTGRALRE
jgi:ABC-2 type transport system ATP-binding protein